MTRKTKVRRRVITQSTQPPATRWTIGIDPGFGLTGLILMAPNGDVAAFATYHSPPQVDVIGRTASIGNAIVVHILEWIWQFNIKELDFGLELPVYRNNAGTLMLQMRLVQEVESGLYHLIGPELQSCFVYEVDPTTSKKLATGNGRADKGEIIGACPLVALWAERPMTQPVMEAVADAWAHTLITKRDNAEKYDMVDIAFVPCDQVCSCVLINTPAESEPTELMRAMSARLLTAPQEAGDG